MEQFAEYGHAIMSVALFAIIALILGPISAARKTGEGVESGGTPTADYASATYRLHRAYLNAAEHVGIFAAVTVAAILTGSNPFWVNLLASVFVASRLVHVLVHLSGIGAPNMGPRTMVYLVGWLACLGLGGLAVAGALT